MPRSTPTRAFGHAQRAFVRFADIDQAGAGTQPGQRLRRTEVGNFDGATVGGSAHAAIIGQRAADRSCQSCGQIRRRVEVAEAHTGETYRMHAERLLQPVHRIFAIGNGR